MVSITPFIAPAASRGEMIRFGSLEFPTIPRDGLWAPPPFPPSQTFQFGSLEFVGMTESYPDSVHDLLCF